MKDTDKVELTVGNIKAAAEKCGTAKEVLKTLCPEVFNEKWRDITEECIIKPDITGAPMFFHQDKPFAFAPPSDWMFSFGFGDKQYEDTGNFKIESGKIWRRESA